MKKFRGSITVFVILMLGLIIGMYLMGFQGAFATYMEGDITDPEASAGTVLTMIVNGAINAIKESWGFLLLAGVVGLAAGALGGGYSAGTFFQYMIPVFILSAVANIFFFPVIPAVSTHTTGNSAFAPITLLLTVIFNVLLFLIVLEFVTGRD